MNPRLTTLSQVLTIIVSVEALIAMVAQWRCRHVQLLWGRVLSVATAAIAGAIFAMYQVLLWTRVDPESFQMLLRGMGLFAWPVVWIYPALFRRRSDRAPSGDRLIVAVEAGITESYDQ